MRDVEILDNTLNIEEGEDDSHIVIVPPGFGLAVDDSTATLVSCAGAVGVIENAGERLTALLALELGDALDDFEEEVDAVFVGVTVNSVVTVDRPNFEVTVADGHARDNALKLDEAVKLLFEREERDIADV